MSAPACTSSSLNCIILATASAGGAYPSSALSPGGVSGWYTFGIMNIMNRIVVSPARVLNGRSTAACRGSPLGCRHHGPHLDRTADTEHRDAPGDRQRLIEVLT